MSFLFFILKPLPPTSFQPLRERKRFFPFNQFNRPFLDACLPNLSYSWEWSSDPFLLDETEKEKTKPCLCMCAHLPTHIHTHSTHANNTTDLIPFTKINSTCNTALNWSYATKKYPDNRRNLADLGQDS